MKKIWFLVACVFLSTSSVFSQTLRSSDDGSKETKIIFSMMNGKPADIYSVNSITVGSTSSVVVGSNGSVGTSVGSMSGVNTSFLCRTPAEMTLDKGFVQLQVGQGMTAKIFTVGATGGTQEWSIKPGSDGKCFGGIMLGSIGGAAAIVGVICGICGLGNGFYGLAAGGAAVGAGGYALTFNGCAKAKLVEIKN